MLRIPSVVLLGLLASSVSVAQGDALALKAAALQAPIDPQPLNTALQAWARQSGIQVMYATQLAAGLKSPGAPAGLSPNDSLKHLLEGTGLEYRVLNDRTVSIMPEGAKGAVPTTGQEIWANPLRLAQSDPTSSLGRTASPETDSDGRPAQVQEAVKLEEVIVTAQKKSERIQDVPVPITVLDTQSLAENNLNRIRDYFATVPGLNLNSSPGSEGGGQYLQIRGVGTTAFGTPTVAVLIDDVPLGASTQSSQASVQYPDIDPSDLARIEVLKGPQGTLYGADSLGGLIKFVTKDPSTAGFTGHIQMLGDGVVAGGFGYGLRAAANIPISDTLAFRVSGFTRQDPGYIENVTTGQKNVNSQNAYGGRIGMMWRLSDALSLKMSALLQNTETNGTTTIDTSSSWRPALGDLQQTGLPGTGVASTQIRAYRATLNARVADVDIISVSGYSFNKLYTYGDFSGSPYFTYPSEYYANAAGGTFVNQTETEKFSQEMRFSSSLGHWLDWLGGLFYTHEAQPNTLSYINANDVPSGAYVSTILSEHYPLTFSEYAIFGDLTFHPTERLDVQVGARKGWNKQFSYTVASGVATPYYYFVPSPYIQPASRSTDSALTYLFTPEFKISPDTMVYARVATGYEVGGPNIVGGINSGSPVPVPPSFKSSTTTNYELGFKSDSFEHRLTVDASIYYIAWRDIQIDIYVPPSIGYYINGGRAKSEGVELSMQARPLRGTEISLSAAFDDAELTQDFPLNSSVRGIAGERLPYSSRFSGSVSVTQDVIRVGDATAFIGASANYVGQRYGEFQCAQCGPRYVFPAYTVVNAHAGVRFDSWNVNLFVNNLANNRGVLGGSLADVLNNTGYFAQVIQPRTVGASIARTF